MHAASRHGTPSLTSLPKDGGVSCFGRSSGGRPSSFSPYQAMLNFSEANRTGWAASPLTPHVNFDQYFPENSEIAASKHPRCSCGCDTHTY